MELLGFALIQTQQLPNVNNKFVNNKLQTHFHIGSMTPFFLNGGYYYGFVFQPATAMENPGSACMTLSCSEEQDMHTGASTVLTTLKEFIVNGVRKASTASIMVVVCPAAAILQVCMSPEWDCWIELVRKKGVNPGQVELEISRYSDNIKLAVMLPMEVTKGPLLCIH